VQEFNDKALAARLYGWDYEGPVYRYSDHKQRLFRGDRMKQNFTEDRLLALCEAVLTHSKEAKHAFSSDLSSIR